ncbi:hypothetical protein D9M69_482670 [compost metagenome]
MAFFSTPGIERLYSGVTNSTPCAAATSLLRRFTGAAWLPSSSWLYSGRSSMRRVSNVKSDGARCASASASLWLNESLRRLPTMTAIRVCAMGWNSLKWKRLSE